MPDLTGAFANLLQARVLGLAHLHAQDLRLLQVNSRIVSLATALEEWRTGAEASTNLIAQYIGIGYIDISFSVSLRLVQLSMALTTPWWVCNY